MADDTISKQSPDLSFRGKTDKNLSGTVRRWVTFLFIFYMKTKFTKSIYKFGLSVCLFVCLPVCLFVSNKRQNGWTDRAQIFFETSRDPREGLWKIKISNTCLHHNAIVINFWKFWKSAKFFVKIHELLFSFKMYTKRTCS